MRLRFAKIHGNGARGREYCRPNGFRNIPSCMFRAWGRGENMSILEETGHPPALCQGRKHGQSSHRLGGRELALQEQFLRDEAKGDSHSEAGQLQESSVLLGTWHQGKCQQEEKGLSGCGSQRRLFCLSSAKLEFRNHQQPPRGRERKVKKTASGGS